MSDIDNYLQVVDAKAVPLSPDGIKLTAQQVDDNIRSFIDWVRTGDIFELTVMSDTVNGYKYPIKCRSFVR